MQNTPSYSPHIDPSLIHLEMLMQRLQKGQSITFIRQEDSVTIRMQQSGDLLTKTEAAHYLGYKDYRSIIRLIEKGELVERTNGRIAVSDLERLKERPKSPPISSKWPGRRDNRIYPNNR